MKSVNTSLRISSFRVALCLFLILTGCSIKAARQEGPDEAEKLRLETFDAAWRIVYDTHYDPEFNGVDWYAQRDIFRPRARAAASNTELREVLGNLLAPSGPSHSIV